MWQPPRQPKYLSHSSLGLFEKTKEEWFLRYLAEAKPPKIPQIPAMAVGAAFDAHVKAELFELLFGRTDPKFELDTLFTDQVEEQNRDFGRVAGPYVLDCYKQSGAFDELAELLKQSRTDPRFESTVEREVHGIPILAKPDLEFTLESQIILDFKVKGYCSKHSPSPTKNYRLCRDGNILPKPNRSHNTAHKGYIPFQHCGVEINQAYLEVGSTTYADQMALYGWSLGAEVGDENTLFFMEEITCKYAGEFQKPLLRVSNHRARVSQAYQQRLLDRYRACWDAVQTGYVFTDMSREDNDSRCEVLNESSKHMSADDWFTSITRVESY